MQSSCSTPSGRSLSRARLSTITFVRVSLREAVHRWLLALRRSASRAQQARSRPWPDLLASRARHLGVFRARSRFALLIFRPVERSESLLRFQSCGVAVRHVSRRIVRSAMIRVPRDPFGISSRARSCSPCDDHDRSKLATSMLEPTSLALASRRSRSFRLAHLPGARLFRMRSPFGNRLRTSSLTLRCSRSRTDSSPYSARSVQRPCSPRCSCPCPDSLTLRRSSPSTFTLTRAAARLCCSLEQHIHARPARAHVHVSCAVIFRCSRTFHARAHPAAFMSALACMIRLSTSHACGARVCAHPSLRSRNVHTFRCSRVAFAAFSKTCSPFDAHALFLAPAPGLHERPSTLALPFSAT